MKHKTTYKVIRVLYIIPVVLAVFFSCSDEEKAPVVETLDPIIDNADTLVLEGFLYPPEGTVINSLGICLSQSHFLEPEYHSVKASSTSPGKFSIKTSTFERDTFYYFQAFAEYSGGYIFGEKKRVRTPHGSVKDIDGNTYATVKIGNQVWMASNYRARHYRNGDPVELIKDETSWKNAKSGAYCYYENNTSFIGDYGMLYNFYAVKDPRGLAPEGWHIPTFEEWNKLISYAGGLASAGGKLKEVGHSHWRFENTGASDYYGFSARAGGVRDYNYHALSYWGEWWSSTTESGLTGGFSFEIDYMGSDINSSFGSNAEGLSVRCIKDPAP